MLRMTQAADTCTAWDMAHSPPAAPIPWAHLAVVLGGMSVTKPSWRGRSRLTGSARGHPRSAHTAQVFSGPQWKAGRKGFKSCRRWMGWKLGRMSAFSDFFFFLRFQNRIHYLTINKNSVKHSFTLPKLLRTHMNRINGKDMGSKSAWLSLRDSHGTRCKANARKSDR